MMLSNISIAVLGLIDTGVVGHLADASYLAGVALAAVVFDFLYWGLTFLRMGTTGVTAQVHGAANIIRMRSVLLESMILAIVLAAVLILARHGIVIFALDLLGGSEGARDHAATYFLIKIWGAPGVLGTMVLIGWLIGMQQARAALLLVAVPCLVNAGLDIILVVFMGMEVRGVAWAAVIGAYSGLTVGLLLAVRLLPRDATGSAGWLRARWSDLAQLLVLNTNILVRTLCLIAVFAFFIRQGARQGDAVLSANSVLLNFQMLMALGIDGFANALEALVGKAIGARARRAFVDSVYVAAGWGVVLAVAFAAAYWLFGASLVRLLTDIEAVRTNALIYLPWAVVSPLVSVWCFIFDGIFIGAMRGREMRNSMLFSTLVVFFPTWYCTQGWANHGLWFAFLMFFAARGASMGWYFVALERRRAFA
jgi:MATE family multidrug resistance protein